LSIEKNNKRLRLKKLKSEDNINTDRYLITYADLITLLLGLFVILYATSQIDESKYKEFSKAFSSYFNSKKGVSEGGKGVLIGEKDNVPEPIGHPTSKKSMQEISNDIQKSLKSVIAKGLISVKVTSAGIVLTLPEKLLFESGKAEVQPEGNTVLDSLANVLQNLSYQITVDGHTDNIPIRTFRFESNWHLSVARALNVGYSMMMKGVPESYMIIRGLGAERPIAENSSQEGRALNRRVEIMISELPTEAASKKGYSEIDTTKK
jgi:chemotaxis protein MotB